MWLLDVCGCAWGWALLVNDAGIGDGSYATSNNVAYDQAEWFEQPQGEGFELARRYFIQSDAARRAAEVYLRVGKLWAGVKWWPEPPNDASFGAETDA
jgi:hypothetical protein